MNGRKKVEGIPADLAPKLAICAGLALRGLVRPAVMVDLLLRKEAVRIPRPLPKEVIRKAASIEIVCCGLLLLSIYLGMYVRMAKVNNELDELRAGRPLVTTKLEVDQMSPADLEGAQGRLKENLTALQTIIDGRVYWTAKLNELAKVLPEGTWLNRIDLKEEVQKRGWEVSRSLTLEGGAFSTDKSEEMGLVNRLLANLKEDEIFFEGFQRIKLSSITKARIGEFEVTAFSLTCSGESKSR